MTRSWRGVVLGVGSVGTLCGCAVTSSKITIYLLVLFSHGRSRKRKPHRRRDKSAAAAGDNVFTGVLARGCWVEAACGSGQLRHSPPSTPVF